jgi:hypothetical protein
VLRAVAPELDPRLLGAALIALIVASVALIGRAYRAQASSSFLLATLTGSLLYSPYLFATRPEHAVAMGVGMHWCQYVAINLPLYRRKSRDESYGGASLLNWNIWQLGAVVLAYAVLMGYLRIDHDLATIGSYDYSLSQLIVIPLVFQNLHYYSEMFTWKFSDPHIRENVGRYIFAPAAEPAGETARA